MLRIRNLSVQFGGFKAVDGVDLDVAAGESLGIVGESGSGKSVTMLALMGLVDKPGVVSADEMSFDGHDMLRMTAKQRRAVVGRQMAMVFQDALTALNPSYRIGYQIEEVLRVHMGLRGRSGAPPRD